MGSLGSPRFCLKGPFKGDIDKGLYKSSIGLSWNDGMAP